MDGDDDNDDDDDDDDYFMNYLCYYKKILGLESIMNLPFCREITKG